LALIEQELVALVGLFGRAVTGELPHRPQPAAVAGVVDATRERVLSRSAYTVVDAVIRSVDRLHGNTRQGVEIDVVAQLRGPVTL
jgi:hypothetical protein